MTFSISAFDFTNGVVLLRIACGLFLLPHIFSKLVGVPLGFFEAAGFRPAGFWMKLAMLCELSAATGLILDIYTQWAALLAAAILLVAVIALSIVNRSVKWAWIDKGIEYPVFWMLCCSIVAVLHWNP